MPIQEYHRPASPAEALALLKRVDVTTLLLIPRPRPSAVPEIRAEAVVDLSGLNLAYISVDAREVRLGAMTPLQTIVEAPELRALVHGVLPEAARLAGHLGMRHLATLEGALLSRKSLPELTLALLTLDAEVVLAKGDGSRLDVSLAEYLVFPWPPDELILEVKWSVEPGQKVGCALERVARAPRDGAVLAVAATLRMEKNVCRQARVALSHAGSEGELLLALISRLEGQVVTSGLLRDVADSVQSAVKPLADFRASADYRREMTGVLTRRALEAAWRRAAG